MKYFLFFFIACTFYLSVSAQNLVPNPSFEDKLGCPNNEDQVYLCKGWTSYGQSPDYFNSCDSTETVGVPYSDNGAGFQYAASGNAFCGLFTYVSVVPNSREFIGSQLTSSLIVGNKYYISIKVNLANDANCATNNIGVAFSTIPFSESTSAPINNQASVFSSTIITDTLNWVIVSGWFIADSTYKYIMIGNFFQDGLTNKIIYSGNSCNAYYYIDDVCVSPDSLGCDLANGITNYSFNKNISIYPNPANDKLYINNTEVKTFSVSFVNLIGQTIKVFTNQKTLNVSDIPAGVYILKINQTDFIKIIINH